MGKLNKMTKKNYVTLRPLREFYSKTMPEFYGDLIDVHMDNSKFGRAYLKKKTWASKRVLHKHYPILPSITM